jgi:hypothetical protein
MWGALSDERTGLAFTISAGPRQRNHSWVRVPLDSWPYFNVSDSRLPQPGAPGPRIYIPQEQGGLFKPSGTGFFFRRLLLLAGLLDIFDPASWAVSGEGKRRGGIYYAEGVGENLCSFSHWPLFNHYNDWLIPTKLPYTHTVIDKNNAARLSYLIYCWKKPKHRKYQLRFHN